MPDDRKQQEGQPSYSLEEILAEFGGGGDGGAETKPASPADDPSFSVPSPPPLPKKEPGEEAVPLKRDEPVSAPSPRDNVIAFPGAQQEVAPLAEAIGRLKRRADEYADRMFEDEGQEISDETLRMERLIPGTDAEQSAPSSAARERKPRPAPPPPPDLPANELWKKYAKSAKSLRPRVFFAFLFTVPLLYLSVQDFFGAPLPGVFSDHAELLVCCCAALLGLVMLLCPEISLGGLVSLFRLRPGADTLSALACLFTLADSLAPGMAPGRDGALPHCAAAALGLFFHLWGLSLKTRGLAQTCRTAGASAAPYLVTLDEARWDGKDAFCKWTGEPHGFGSQVQREDGAQRIYRVASPLLILACVCFSLLSSAGRGEPGRLIWCLSGLFSAAASFSGFLCFGLPFSALSVRLAKGGAALAGWEGARSARRKSNILLTDADLFPPGNVSLNGIKVFGDFSVEKVVAVTATLIRDAGSGLDQVFHNLLRAQGATYRKAAGFRFHEGGGLSAEIRGEEILAGTSAFMNLMEIALPPGLNIKNAVFCAIDGELAGVFALNYTLHGSVSPALGTLLRNRIGPVLATRDFNLFPAMLRQKFKLPVERMAYPSVERRWALSSESHAHSQTITALLSREGLSSFSDAAVGAGRLRAAVRFSTALSVAGSCVGTLLAFYLTYIGAFSSLSPANLTAFLLLWTVPTFLISGWVNRY